MSVDSKPVGQEISSVEFNDIDPKFFRENVEVLDRYDVNEYVTIEIVKSNITKDVYYIANEPSLTYKFDEKTDWYKEVYEEDDLERDYSVLLPLLKKKVEDELRAGNMLQKDIEERRETVRDKAKEILDNINTGYNLTDYPLNAVNFVDEKIESDRITGSRPVKFAKKKSLDYSKKREKIPDLIYDRLIYYIERDLAGYDRLQPLFDDDHIEDLSVNRPNSPTTVYHDDYGEHILTNIGFDSEELARFSKKLAQQAGKNLSRAKPTVDGSLLDGSRIRINYRDEVSPDGTSFTIRFQDDIPLTPISLINYGTYNYEQMAYLWLLIQNKKSVIVAGGTASGKTTTVNALTMFMDRNYKIITIEDTQEVVLPHINYSKRLTRESVVEGDDSGDIDEFDLVRGALRERPDFILVGEVRGKEANSMFQAMNTGHATVSTLHANEPSSVIQRLESGEIDVSRGLMEAMDLIVVQNRQRGTGAIRAQYMQELEDMNSDGRFNASNMYDYDSESDDYNKLYSNSSSSALREIMQSQRWTEEDLDNELNDRIKVLKKMQSEGIENYIDCYTIFQHYMSDKESVMEMIENDEELIDIIEDNILPDSAKYAEDDSEDDESDDDDSEDQEEDDNEDDDDSEDDDKVIPELTESTGNDEDGKDDEEDNSVEEDNEQIEENKMSNEDLEFDVDDKVNEKMDEKLSVEEENDEDGSEDNNEEKEFEDEDIDEDHDTDGELDTSDNQ